MPASRGKGKVVARQASGILDNDGVITVAADNALKGDPWSTSEHVKALTTAPSLSSFESTKLAHSLSNHESISVAVQPSQGAGINSIVHSSPDPTSQQQWRCAPFIEGGVPWELQARQLGTRTSRQLLRQQQPILIRGQHLASCRLSNLVTKSASPPGIIGSTAAAADTVCSTATHGNSTYQLEQPQPQQHIAVLCSPAETNRFMQADQSRNAPGSYYHVRKPETTELHMTFQEWCDSWQTWNSNRIILQVLLCTWKLKSDSGGALVWPSTAVWPQLSRLLDMAATVQSPKAPEHTTLAATASAAQGSGKSPIDWTQLRQFLTDGQYNTTGQLHLLAGGRDALLPAKYDTSDRLICQVAGRQKLLLLPPELAFKGLYPYPVAHPYDRFSCVDWEAPELEHWPQAAQVKGLVCELSPGDTLLVPAYWFVHQQLQQPACVALVLQLQPKLNKLLNRDGLMMQLSRMIECWVSSEIGTANVRRWLLALAEGREWQQIANQLITVAGYKQAKICHMILKHLQQVLALNPSRASGCPAPAAPKQIRECNQWIAEHNQLAKQPVCRSALEVEARQFLSAMCDERLMPTDWLNEGITDPLYLKYQPQHYLIREDAQAARYPTLLRHKLIEHKENWIEHAERLQLTGRHSIKRLMG